MIDKELLAMISFFARKKEFHTTSGLDSKSIRELKNADLIDIYDMYPDGRIRWWPTSKGRALLEAEP